MFLANVAHIFIYRMLMWIKITENHLFFTFLRIKILFAFQQLLNSRSSLFIVLNAQLRVEHRASSIYNDNIIAYNHLFNRQNALNSHINNSTCVVNKECILHSALNGPLYTKITKLIFEVFNFESIENDLHRKIVLKAVLMSSNEFN